MPHPQHVNANHKGIAATDRQRQALELRKAGVGFQVIADRLGYKDHSGAYRAVRSALLKTLQQPADEVRKIEVERLDTMLIGLWGRATKGDTVAVDRVLKIMDRRAALLGLDAPRKLHHDGEIDVRQVARELAGEFGRPIDDIIAEAEQIVRENQQSA